MLVLSRKKKQAIKIGEGIIITVVKIKGGVVRIGVEAPHELKILRAELEELDRPDPEEEVSHAA